MTSYCTIAEANTYFATHIFADSWTDNAGKQQIALDHATKLINNLPIRGTKADENQENEFPRYNDTGIPTPVKEACAEIALALLDGIDPNREIENLRLVGTRYGGVGATYEPNNAPLYILAGIPSPVAWLKLQPFLISQG
jgi:hypothetical protein